VEKGTAWRYLRPQPTSPCPLQAPPERELPTFPSRLDRRPAAYASVYQLPSRSIATQKTITTWTISCFFRRGRTSGLNTKSTTTATTTSRSPGSRQWPDRRPRSLNRQIVRVLKQVRCPPRLLRVRSRMRSKLSWASCPTFPVRTSRPNCCTNRRTVPPKSKRFLSMPNGYPKEADDVVAKGAAAGGSGGGGKGKGRADEHEQARNGEAFMQVENTIDEDDEIERTAQSWVDIPKRGANWNVTYHDAA
jgi:hypothetical protein